MLPKQYHKFVHKKVFPLRRHECSGNTLDIEAMKGVGFRHMVRLQEYNYKANKVEPINLEKAKIQMRIYKPNYEVSLKLIHKQTKKEVNIPIKLSEEDMFNIHGLKTDLEIKRYLIELSRKQKLLKVDKDIDKIISEIELSKTDD